MDRRRFLLSTASVAGASLAGCASFDPGGAPGPAVAAPSFAVGDRWVYRVRDGFRAPLVWEEVHDVTAIGAQGITVRVSAKGPSIDVERVEYWPAPGVLATGAVFSLESKRYAPPLVVYRYPMVPGERWSSSARDPDLPPNPFGPVDRYTIVGGYETIATPAGTFDALRLRVFMRLDDEEFWRYPTECTYLVWYAPAVGRSVREEREAEYQEKGSGRFEGFSRIRNQHALIELVAHSRRR
jgi:hypothetical protein